MLRVEGVPVVCSPAPAGGGPWETREGCGPRGRPRSPLALHESPSAGVLVCRGEEHGSPATEVGAGDAAAGMRVASDASTRIGPVALAAGPGYRRAREQPAVPPRL